MEHVRIFLYFFLIISGGISLFSLYSNYSGSQIKIFKPLFYYLLFVNFVILSDLISRYLTINLFDKCILYYTSGFFLVVGPLNSLFFLIMTYYLFKIYLFIEEREFPGKYKKAFIIFLFFLIPSYILRIFFFVENEYFQLLILIHFALPVLAVLVHFIIIISVAGEEKNSAEKKFAQQFVSIPVLSSLVLIISGIFFSELIRIFLVFIALLSLNILPVLQLKKHLKIHLEKNKNQSLDDILDEMCRKFEISPREREVIKLIIEGKSNKEIVDNLFISSHTVKNHIYNVYQKVGVTSRSQLTKLILTDSFNN